MSQMIKQSATPCSVVAPGVASQTLDRVVHAALASVPGFSYAGVSIVYRDGWVDTVAATDRLVWDIHALQFAFDEGPYLAAMLEDPVVIAPDLASDLRWPQYGLEAAERIGLKSQIALRVYVDEDTLGVLSLYSTQSTVIAPDAVQTAERFANHAALAMGRPAMFEVPSLLLAG